MIQLIQQWLPTSGRSKNPVVVQCTRLNVSADLQHMQNTEETAIYSSEGMDMLQRGGEVKQEKGKHFLLPCLYIGCQSKMLPRLKDFATLKDLD